MTSACRKYIHRLSASDKTKMLVAAIERLIETEEVAFLEDDYCVDEDMKEHLYWKSSGDNLLDDET